MSSTDELFKNLMPQETSEQPSEIDYLKNRARLMGVSFSNNIGVEALRAKIQAKLDGETKAPSEGEAVAQDAVVEAKPVKKQSLRDKLYKENMRLIRCRIQNLDPKKKDLPGEIFTVANRFLGSVKKYVPYGEATDGGYHIPNIIYKQLKRRKFTQIKTKVDNRGRKYVETSDVREFAIEVLPPLTQVELNKLAAAQAAKIAD